MFGTSRHDRFKRAALGTPGRDSRIVFLRGAMIAAGALIVLRLFSLQVLSHDFYSSLANGQHALFQELLPARGEIFFQDLKDGTVTPVATNRQLAFVWAEPRKVKEPATTARVLGEIF